MTTTAAKGRASKRREIEDAVSYAIGHVTRIQILALLNEGVRTQMEISRELRLPQSTVHHHIAELLRSNSIEEVDSRQVGNLVEHRYRALKKGEYSLEDYRQMDDETGKATIGGHPPELDRGASRSLCRRKDARRRSKRRGLLGLVQCGRGGACRSHGGVGRVLATSPGNRGSVDGPADKIEGGGAIGSRLLPRPPPGPAGARYVLDRIAGRRTRLTTVTTVT